MFRSILLAAALGLAAPLSADALMDQLFDGKKPEKVARDWFKTVPGWLNKLSKESRHATSWFKRPADNVLAPYRIDEADALTISARELQETGELDNGKPVRAPSADITKFTWADWESTWFASTYPVETNPNKKDVVAFAGWLYTEREASWSANSVLATVYLDDRYIFLREPIAQFIRARHKIKAGAPLATFEMWDKYARAFRKVLIEAGQAKEFTDGRQRDAQNRLTELSKDYKIDGKVPADRKLTLAMLEFEVRQWSKTFGETQAAKDEKLLKVQADLLKAIADDVNHVAIYEKAGQTHLDDKNPAKAAAEFEKALALDPMSLNLLSRAANARFEDVHPELINNRVVGKGNAADAAMKLYERWLVLQPANAKVILSIGQLYHVKGDTTNAPKKYAEVINLKPEAATLKIANKFKEAAEKNPRNQ